MSDPMVPDERRCDVVVLGGGSAGLAAALQLARARRSVVVVDAGEPRNAPAAHMHGYLGHEGRPPADFLAIGRAEVEGYGVEVVDGRVTAVAGHTGRFRAELADGTSVAARRVLVATGLADVLPDIPGVAEQWGRGVIHCPYCHGWEVRDRTLVVIATGPPGAHQAALFRQLSDRVTLVVHDGPGPDPTARAQLRARHVPIVDGPVAEVVTGPDDQVAGVRLVAGTTLPADAVVVGPRFVARVEPLAPLGITTVPGPMGMGEVIETDASGATAVAGVYAAGNVTDPGNQVLQAAAEGSRIAAMLNVDLVAADTAEAMAAHASAGTDAHGTDAHGTDAHGGDVAGEWDERYAGHDQMWSGAANGALVVEMAEAAPGRALDVGCGEGGDAVWLAARGWQVTAVDVSRVAVDRAREAARTAGVDVDWVVADVLRDPPAAGAYDLVSVQYPALPLAGGDAVGALLAAVAPGGTLLVVGHALADADIERMRERGIDPADYVQPPDVAARLDDAWLVEVDETRPRTVAPPPGTAHVHDIVLRARRRR